MKGDPKTPQQMVQSGEMRHPQDVLAEMYFDSLARSEQAEDTEGRADYLKVARDARKSLAKSGLKPVILNGKVEFARVE